MVLAAGAVVACLATAAAGNAVCAVLGRGDASWTLTGSLLGGAALFELVNVLLGAAFGALFMNSAVAIVLYFILPTAWTILGNLIAALHRAAEWLDPGSTLAPLQSGAAMSGQSWAKVGTSVAVWVGLPMLVGVVRLLRREVK